MRYVFIALLLIAFLPACKKKDLSPSFSATLSGEAYPPKGFYPNWNNWQSGSNLTTLGTDTMLIVSSQWGFTDTNYSANTYTPYARLEFDIRGFGYSAIPGFTVDNKYLDIIKTGTIDLCSNASSPIRCASISMLDNNGHIVSSTDLGDNTGSTFTITGNGAEVNIGGVPLTSYTATFSCKLYTSSGSSQTFTGTSTNLVTY